MRRCLRRPRRHRSPRHRSPSAFQTGHEHSWYVNSCNRGGYVRSVERSFSIKCGCPADFDGNDFLNGEGFIRFVYAFEVGC